MEFSQAAFLNEECCALLKKLGIDEPQYLIPFTGADLVDLGFPVPAEDALHNSYANESEVSFDDSLLGTFSQKQSILIPDRNTQLKCYTNGAEHLISICNKNKVGEWVLIGLYTDSLELQLALLKINSPEAVSLDANILIDATNGMNVSLFEKNKNGDKAFFPTKKPSHDIERDLVRNQFIFGGKSYSDPKLLAHEDFSKYELSYYDQTMCGPFYFILKERLDTFISKLADENQYIDYEIKRNSKVILNESNGFVTGHIVERLYIVDIVGKRYYRIPGFFLHQISFDKISRQFAIDNSINNCPLAVSLYKDLGRDGKFLSLESVLTILDTKTARIKTVAEINYQNARLLLDKKIKENEDNKYLNIHLSKFSEVLNSIDCSRWTAEDFSFFETIVAQISGIFDDHGSAFVRNYEGLILGVNEKLPQLVAVINTILERQRPISIFYEKKSVLEVQRGSLPKESQIVYDSIIKIKIETLKSTSNISFLKDMLIDALTYEGNTSVSAHVDFMKQIIKINQIHFGERALDFDCISLLENIDEETVNFNKNILAYLKLAIKIRMLGNTIYLGAGIALSESMLSLVSEQHAQEVEIIRQYITVYESLKSVSANHKLYSAVLSAIDGVRFSLLNLDDIQLIMEIAKETLIFSEFQDFEKYKTVVKKIEKIRTLYQDADELRRFNNLLDELENPSLENAPYLMKVLALRQLDDDLYTDIAHELSEHFLKKISSEDSDKVRAFINAHDKLKEKCSKNINSNLAHDIQMLGVSILLTEMNFEAIDDLNKISSLTTLIEKVLADEENLSLSKCLDIAQEIQTFKPTPVSLEENYSVLLSRVGNSSDALKENKEITSEDIRNYYVLALEVKNTKHSIYFRAGEKIHDLMLDFLDSCLNENQKHRLAYVKALEKIKLYENSKELKPIYESLNKITDIELLPLLTEVANNTYNFYYSRYGLTISDLEKYDQLINNQKIPETLAQSLNALSSYVKLLFEAKNKQSAIVRPKPSNNTKTFRENETALEIVQEKNHNAPIDLSKLNFATIPSDVLKKIDVYGKNNDSWADHRGDNDTYIIRNNGVEHFLPTVYGNELPGELYNAAHVTGFAAGINGFARAEHNDSNTYMSIHLKSNFTRIFDERYNHLFVVERDISIADKRGSNTQLRPKLLSFDVIHVYEKKKKNNTLENEWDFKGSYVEQSKLNLAIETINNLEKVVDSIPNDRNSPALRNSLSLDSIKDAKANYESVLMNLKKFKNDKFKDLRLALRGINTRNLSVDQILLLTKVANKAVVNGNEENVFSEDFILEIKKIFPSVAKKMTEIVNSAPIKSENKDKYNIALTSLEQYSALSDLRDKLKSLTQAELKDEDFELLTEVVSQSIAVSKPDITSNTFDSYLDLIKKVDNNIKTQPTDKLTYAMFIIFSLAALACFLLIISPVATTVGVSVASTYLLTGGSVTGAFAGIFGSNIISNNHFRAKDRYSPLYDAMKNIHKQVEEEQTEEKNSQNIHYNSEFPSF